MWRRWPWGELAKRQRPGNHRDLEPAAPGDPLTFAVTVAVLTVAALTACCVPAWRAARVHPMTALSGE